MGRQFRFYLLPSDVERLVAMLRDQMDARLLDETSQTFTPVEIDSPFMQDTFRRGTRSIHCYLTQAGGAHVKTQYIKGRGPWFVDGQSEVIEFSGWEFDGEVLVLGRMYFQTDFLMGGQIWKKRPEFVRWADRVFRTAKEDAPLVKGNACICRAGCRRLEAGRRAIRLGAKNSIRIPLGNEKVARSHGLLCGASAP